MFNFDDYTYHPDRGPVAPGDLAQGEEVITADPFDISKEEVAKQLLTSASGDFLHFVKYTVKDAATGLSKLKIYGIIITGIKEKSLQ